MRTFQYEIYGCAHDLFPTETHFGLFSLADNTVADIPQQYPFSGPWGECGVENVSIQREKTLPKEIELLYLSVAEKKFYYLKTPVNPHVLESIYDDLLRRTDSELVRIIVGMAPYGYIALWLGNDRKQSLLGWLKGCEIQLPMEEFLPERSDLSLAEYCQAYIEKDVSVKDYLCKNCLPPRHLFDEYMKQFTYRYLILFEHWDADEEKWHKIQSEKEDKMPNFDYIGEALFDGTHDKLRNGDLMNYHKAGKPKKLAVKWHIKKSEYTAYFWFEDEAIRNIFDRFYGAHPETKTDFMIRIDSEKNKYELALYRYGLKEPQVISESAYQLLVFKNKFEYYRSENYNQPRGAWIW